MPYLSAITLLLLLGLPLLGPALTGVDLSRYLEFPPQTRYVEHAPFAWAAFVALAALIAVVIGPFVLRILQANGQLRLTACPQAMPAGPEGLPPGRRRAFPLWGWGGVVFGLISWLLAWTRFPWFAPFQPFTFSPLWLAYIVGINALTFRRSGHCMLVDRPLYLARLFAVSAGFWWFFEYLNRFVQNWYYVGIGNLTRWEYFLFATLPFSTVLPAVLGTYDLLATYPRLEAGLAEFVPVRVRHPKIIAAVLLVAAVLGLAGIGVWPDWLFPLLWLAPLIMITCLQALRGQPTLFADTTRGDWRRIWRLAVAALICGLCWEMWNYGSLAKWIYTVPYVNRFKLFEMPILGYAGYLPFGLECAVVALWVKGNK